MPKVQWASVKAGSWVSSHLGCQAWGEGQKRGEEVGRKVIQGTQSKRGPSNLSLEAREAWVRSDRAAF